MLQVWLLGQFNVHVDGRRVIITSRPAQSLLAYLILTAGTPHRREKLAGLLWSDLPEENARRNLRHELWRLRKTLASPTSASDYILAEEFTLGFNPGAVYWLDVAQLVKPETDLDVLSSNLSLYRGELLPGLYDDWITLERERIQRQFEGKIQQFLEGLIQAENWNAAIEWSERWIVLGQTPEPAYRALMVAHHALGSTAQVAIDYERCIKALRDDLGVEPSTETRALYQALTRGEAAGPVITPSLQAVLVKRPSLRGTSTATEPPAPGEPPFKGLDFFDQGDANLFFGREELTQKLAQSLRLSPTLLSGEHQANESHFLAVVIGASGSGKSSLVRAGLIPTLTGAVPAEPTHRAWRVFVLTPTAHPLEALAAVLTRESESVTATATLMDDLARDPRALYLFLRRIADESQSLLVIDQFEELFTLCRDELEREQFIDNLLFALSQASETAALPVTVVITLRADFYAHLAQYPELRDLVSKHQEYIGPMNPEELRRAIEDPAKQGGWEFEPGLVDMILRDVGEEPGALPLLSHALLETWKRRSGHTLTFKGYHAAGGVRSAIGQTAETVYHQFTPIEQETARRVFLRLTELGAGTEDTRRRASFDELIPRGENSEMVRTVILQLADARLITTSEHGVEVAHEALIREWDRLREWLNEDREGLRLHRHLTEAAIEWELLERDPGALYRGTHLAQARDWAVQNPQALNAQELAFLDASDEHEKQETREREAQRQRELDAARKLAETELRANNRLRRRAIFLAGAFLLAVILAGVALVLGSQARASAVQAQSNAALAEQNAANANNAQATAVANQDAAHNSAAEAVKQQRIATARELAANALGNLDIDPERSILLALEAVKTTAPDNTLLPEAEDALHRAVLATRVERSLPFDTGVYRAVFSPDGMYLATMGRTVAKIWDTASWTPLFEIPMNSDGGSTMAFSRDGAQFNLVDYDAGDEQKTLFLRIYETQSGKLVRSVKLPISYPDNWWEGMNPDSTRVAIPDARDNVVLIFDTTTGELVLTLKGHTGLVAEAAYSPDGTRIVTSSRDQSAKVWDAATGQELLTLPHGTNEVSRALFSPDGTKIATAGADMVVKIWDAQSGAELLALRGHTNSLQTARWSPDGKKVASVGLDSRINLWNIETGQQELSFPAHDDIISDVAFTPDGKQLVTASLDETVKLWDLMPNHESRAFLTPPPLLRFAVSADQKRFATTHADGTAIVWDMQTGEPLFTVPPANEELLNDYQVALNGDGSRVAVLRSDDTLGIWDVTSGEQVASFPISTIDPIYRISFSPDGNRLASISDENHAKVWDVTTGSEVASFEFQGGAGAALSPDGSRLLAGTWNGKLFMWDIATRKKIFEQQPHSNVIWGIEYSPDGKRIITTSRDRTAKVLDAETGQELLTLTGHGGTVFRGVYSPDGKTIATSSCDATAKLWDAETGTELLTLRADKLCLYWVEFSPDGKRLLTSSDDGGVREYLLELNDLVELAKTRLTRSWREDECQEYLHLDKCPLEE